MGDRQLSVLANGSESEVVPGTKSPLPGNWSVEKSRLGSQSTVVGCWCEFGLVHGNVTRTPFRKKTGRGGARGGGWGRGRGGWRRGGGGGREGGGEVSEVWGRGGGEDAKEWRGGGGGGGGRGE